MTTEYLLEKPVNEVLDLLTPGNRLAMQVALRTGLRIGDVLALRTEDVIRGPRWWITEAKTGKRRMVILPEALWRELKAHAGDTWVFPSRCDGRKHRTRQAVWADVKRAAKAYRLPQNVGPHSARKVYAVGLLEKYGDIERVQKALNHSNVNVTLVYAMADKALAAKGKKKRRRKAARQLAVDK